MSSLFGNSATSGTTCASCSGVCGRDFSGEVDAMPSVIYGKVTVDRTGDTASFEMSRAFIYDPNSCNICGGQTIIGVVYSSYMWKLVDNGVTNPNSSDEVCCVQMSLSVTCAEGDTDGTATGSGNWSWAINWSGGESITFILTDCGPGGSSSRQLSSCNPIEGTWQVLGLAEAAACVLAGDPGNTATIQISESSLGGSASPCRWACCYESPPVYFATLISECPKLNGRVIPLYRDGGAWVGSVSDEGCCPENFCGMISIFYSHSTWSVDDTECGAVANISVGPCGGVASLFIETGEYRCPPYTLSGVTVPCPQCCPTGTAVSVIISG